MSTYVDGIHPVGEWRNSDPIEIQGKRERPLLLYFWRSHTPESVNALHELNELVRTQQDFPVDVVAIHAPEFDPEESDWEEILDHFKIDLPVFHDPQYHTWERFGVQHAPSYLLIRPGEDEPIRRVGKLRDSGILDQIFS